MNLIAQKALFVSLGILFNLVGNVSADPANCSGAIGSCNYYFCREEIQHCGESGYFLGFGLPYCEKYAAEAPTFSDKGRMFLREVRDCLQRDLETTVGYSQSCADVKSFAVWTHPRCYLDSGYCNLVRQDKEKVIRIARSAAVDPNVMSAFLTVLMRCL